MLTLAAGTSRGPRDVPFTPIALRMHLPKGISQGGRRKYQTTVGSAFTHSHNIRQYMSYKIDACALMNALLETWPELIFDLSTTGDSIHGNDRTRPHCTLQNADPWLLYSESLLQELARGPRKWCSRAPVRNDIVGPINTVIDALWDLEDHLRYCIYLHYAGQRDFTQ